MHVVGPITDSTLAGICRDGRERGRGQVDGLTREGVFQVASRTEAADTLAGLRDSAMIRLMSDCLLRIPEAVAVDIEDIDNTLTIRSSKTDQVGTAVSLAQSGATLVDMQTAGRWGDPTKMPAHYAKAELAERGAVARSFYGK